MSAPAVNSDLSLVLIALMKGITSREDDPALWQSLLDLQARVREYVAVAGKHTLQPRRAPVPECEESQARRRRQRSAVVLVLLPLALLGTASAEPRWCVRDGSAPFLKVYTRCDPSHSLLFFSYRQLKSCWQPSWHIKQQNLLKSRKSVVWRAGRIYTEAVPAESSLAPFRGEGP